MSDGDTALLVPLAGGVTGVLLLLVVAVVVERGSCGVPSPSLPLVRRLVVLVDLLCR